MTMALAGASGARAGVTTRSGLPSKADQIATLKAALTTITGKINGNSPRYGDADLRDLFSYHVDSLWKQGIDGAGTTVAVLEGWTDPNITSTIDNLDTTVGLPDPTISTVFPTGPPPASCPAGMTALGSEGSCNAWAGEVDLDVEAVHLIAPYASIIISDTPSDSEIVGDAASEASMPEITQAMEYITNNHLADVMSVSDANAEGGYSAGRDEVTAQDIGEVTAAANGVPLVASSGNCGVLAQEPASTALCATRSSGPAVSTWADSPWVTAVGGSNPARTAPCPPCTTASGEDAFTLSSLSGAGLSEIYPRPAYQNVIAPISGSPMRSLPDITMDAADGTDESTPLFAGVLALATQARGKDLGAINQLLYERLAATPAASGLLDVTTGANSAAGVPGYAATPGYDVASGWGTVDAAKLVPALAKADAAGNPMTAAAAAEVTRLDNTLHVSPSTTVGPAQAFSVTSSGFLPGHPVTLSVDGTQVGLLAADSSGAVGFQFTPDDLSLSLGSHTLTIHSMLLDQTETITVKSVETTTPRITSPKDGTRAKTQRPTLAGTGTVGDTIAVDNHAHHVVCATFVSQTGAWSCTPVAALPPGKDTLFAVQTSSGSSLNSTPVTVDVPGVPGRPTGVNASRHGSHVSLTWHAPAAGGGLPVTGYRVLRATAKAGHYTRVASPKRRSYASSKLAAHKTYYYKVEAVNAVGVSPASKPVKAASH
jgi:hypothetical protein